MLRRHTCILWMLLLVAEFAAGQGPAPPADGVAPAETPRLPVEVVSSLPAELSTHQPISISNSAADDQRASFAQATDPIALSDKQPRKNQLFGEASAGGQSSYGTLLTVISSLAIVLAVFFFVAWISRKAAPRGLSPLPNEVVESLGRAPLVGRQQAQLLRVGKKLVLVSITPSGVETITEITEPAEVDRLAGLCQQMQAGSITDSFRSILSQYANEPAPGGFVGSTVRR